jgi:hypothetical protein
MTNPCRACSLCEADKNNPTCLKCSKRVMYVSSLGRDLCFAACRTDLEACAPVFPSYCDRPISWR